ncbi:MAG TPA: STAS domain-containing protein [Pilimelia sp.]|nr:STAS domain-containing protein [Pilimelia sp.]
MTFTIDVEQRGVATALRLTGELDMATAPQVRDRIEQLIADGRPRIVVDLHDLAFCDSAGLTTFIQGDKHCAAHGGWLRLARPEGQVARMMHLSGVLALLEYRPDDGRPS